MTSISRSSATVAAAMFLALSLPQPAPAQSISPVQRTEIEKIIRDYLLANPEVLQEAYSELERRKIKAALQSVSQDLFHSSRHVVLGNPKGDVTLVEFFDYNCGFCKRALDDMLALLQTDSKLKIILKEFPVLGPESMEVAQVAVAVRMQDKSGKRYLDFHQKLLGQRGTINRAQALAAAKDAGLDMSRLEKDMASDEIKETLAENFKIADALGINGTPTYVVGSEMLVGAVGLAALKEKINTTRCGKAIC
ncbi:MAG: DsbA family protein [Xanthobacteraceae bacterium]